MSIEEGYGSYYDQVYYKDYQIEEILNNWSEIQALKEKISSVPSSTGYIDTDSKWKWEEGHTLWDLSPKNTRVHNNPRKFIEDICCMTADIEYFRKYLTLEENLVLSMLTTLNKENIPDHLSKRSKIVISKLTRIINNTEVNY